MGHEPWLERFISVYSDLGTTNLTLLEQVYHADIHFTDPIHDVKGINYLLTYFDSLYTNLNTCRFNIDKVMTADMDAAIYWTMTFSHPKLNNGNEISVEGHSFLSQQDNKVIRHRDYLDVGSMLYEHIPLLGAVIKSIKKRASQ